MAHTKRTYKLDLESINLSLDFVLLRIVERLVWFSSAVNDSGFLDFGGGDSGASRARGRGRLRLFGGTVRGGGLGLGCHDKGGRRGRQREARRWWSARGMGVGREKAVVTVNTTFP